MEKAGVTDSDEHSTETLETISQSASCLYFPVTHFVRLLTGVSSTEENFHGPFVSAETFPRQSDFSSEYAPPFLLGSLLGQIRSTTERVRGIFVASSLTEPWIHCQLYHEDQDKHVQKNICPSLKNHVSIPIAFPRS
jgi:hypothetical protein